MSKPVFAGVPPGQEAVLEAARLAASSMNQHPHQHLLAAPVIPGALPLALAPAAMTPEQQHSLAFLNQYAILAPILAHTQQQQQQQIHHGQQPAASGGSHGFSFGGLSEERPASRAGERGAKSSDSKNSSAYASRHQAAEQRRRSRINER